MKKIFILFCCALFSVAFCAPLSFPSSQSARANTVDDVIASVNVYNQKGEELTDGPSLGKNFLKLTQILLFTMARFKARRYYDH